MNVRTNSSMKALLGADAEFPERITMPCPLGLVAVLRDGFKEVDGCVVPKQFEGGCIWSADRPRLDNQDDETGFECSLSEIHIEDFVGNDQSLADTARSAVAYAMRLRDALLQSNASGVFRIIIDAQLPDPDLDGIGNACTVRFHKIRDQVWLADDLEGYKLNAVLVIEFAAAEA